MSVPIEDPIDSAVLLRFVSGASSAEESLLVEQWAAAEAARRTEIDLLRHAWDVAAQGQAPAWDVGALWERIEQEIRAPSARRTGGSPDLSPHSGQRTLTLMPVTSRPRWWMVPAWLAVAAGIVAGVAVIGRDLPERGATRTEPAMRAYTTERGERAELRLADGSRVVLGGGSTLRVPRIFAETARELYLDGEAYFEVTHDPARPFRVHTQRSITEDLGTRFVVVAYRSDTAEQVAVAEGAVVLHGAGVTGSVILRARDVGRVSAAGQVSTERGVTVDRYFSWLNGVVEFDGDPLAEAMRVVERQYGIEVRITDSRLGARRFTGSISGATLHQDLRSLALLLDARYERQGNTVILTPLR